MASFADGLIAYSRIGGAAARANYRRQRAHDHVEDAGEREEIDAGLAAKPMRKVKGDRDL
jgi:hypothetical protein